MWKLCKQILVSITKFHEDMQPSLFLYNVYCCFCATIRELSDCDDDGPQSLKHVLSGHFTGNLLTPDLAQCSGTENEAKTGKWLAQMAKP